MGNLKLLTLKGSRLERVLTTKNDASLGLRQVQVEGKGRGVLVGLIFSFQFWCVFRLMSIFSLSDYEAISEGRTSGRVQGHSAFLQ